MPQPVNDPIKNKRNSSGSGRIVINGYDVGQHAAEIKQNIGVLPESNGYYNWMTGREYLTAFSEFYRIKKEQIKKRVEETLELVNLADKADIQITHYSRGMRQRLGLAKTMIHDPLLIFLDEPTLGLDPQGQKDIQNIILNLNRERGVTIFITSHLLKEVAEICNKVAIVKQGHLTAEDGLSQLLEHHRDQVQKERVTLEDVFFHLTSSDKKEM